MTHHKSGAADLPEALRKGDCGFWQWHPEIHPQGDHSMQALTDGDKRYGWREVALAAGQAVAPADGWLQDGGLLYRLTDERHPCNRDEINVTMADGSRSLEDRSKRAGELLNCIRARPTPPAMDGGEDAARMDWLCDPDSTYWVHINAEPDRREVFNSSQVWRLRAAIDAARAAQKEGESNV